MSWKIKWYKTSEEQNKVKIMKRQRNTTEMKKQTINTQVQVNEEEIGIVSEK